LAAGAGAGVTVAAGGAFLINAAITPRAICGIPVLRYRLVGRPIPGSILNDLRLPQSKFEAHMRHVRRRGYVPVTLDEAVARRNEQAFLDANPICITFDGPYASFATSAWPVLCRYRLNRVTLFYPAGYLGQSELKFPEGRPEPLLGPKTLTRLIGEGVSLGLLAPLNRGDTQESLVAELSAGNRVLSDFQGFDPTFAAFPFSLPSAVEAARQVGLKGAAVLGDGVLRSSGSPFAMPRFAVQPDTEVIQLAMVLSRRAGSSAF
jgi:hypothetical protein